LIAGRDFRRFASAIHLEQRCNLNVPARILLNGDFTFCPISNFNGLMGQRQHARQPLRDKLHESLGRQHKGVLIPYHFEGLGLPSRNSFDLLVKIIVVRRS
jgi:hypothetical protein